MKLSEIKTLPSDKAMGIIATVAFHAGNITENEHTVSLIEKDVKKLLAEPAVQEVIGEIKGGSKMTFQQVGFRVAGQIELTGALLTSTRLIAALMGTHRADVYGIVSVLTETTVDALKLMPMNEFGKLALSCIDRDLVSLFGYAASTDKGV